MKLTTKVRATVERFGLLETGDKVLIACSGGADSMALLAALLELRPVFGLRLALAHFNHRLRRSAERDERFVVRVAARYDLPLYLKREEVRAYAADRGLNVEEAARERRYAFLRKTAERIGATKIATGHTMNDQAETVLMHLLRGTGPVGLAGISPRADGLIIRPLLEVERSEVTAFLQEKRIPYCEDETNRDLRCLRNRVRLRLIPYLQKNFEPRVVRHLARLAEISRGEEEWLARVVQPLVGRVLIKGKGSFRLDGRALASLPTGAARRTVREFIAALKGDLRRISFENVEAVRCLRNGEELRLPGSLTLVREGDRIFPGVRRRERLPFEYPWDGEKPMTIEEIGLRFTAKKILRKKAGRLRFSDARRAYLDAARLRFPLVVRSRRPGDLYRPLGAPGRKKVKEMMRERRLPLAERERLPVFVSGGRIVWVLGLPVADEVKVTDRTERLVILSAGKAR